MPPPPPRRSTFAACRPAGSPRLLTTRLPGVLKLTLQLLVCLTIGLRCAALFGQLRRAWIADGLTAEFQRELRRRGLLIRTPAHPAD